MKMHLKPRIVHGLPVTPAALLNQLRGESFCVSFAAPNQTERAIELVDKNGILVLDNGAFTHWRSGKGKIDAKAYFAWANAIQARCEVAVAVIPDVIEGSEEANWQEAAAAVHKHSAYTDRLMFIWHMNESLEQLAKACRLFNFVGIGSCAEYDVQKNRAGYDFRLKEAAAVIYSVEAVYRRRPWIHLMRGLGVLPDAIWVNSADSSNLARNHCRTRGQAAHVARFANRIRVGVMKAMAIAPTRAPCVTTNFAT